MAVILGDGNYTVTRRDHPWTTDAHGVAVPAALGQPGPARPGAATEGIDGTWRLRLDPAEWPLEAGDAVSDGTRQWTVTGQPRRIAHPIASDVDYVTATAALTAPEVP